MGAGKKAGTWSTGRQVTGMLQVLQADHSLSTKFVDKLWIRVLMKSKSDIFTRDFYALPYFYTSAYSLFINMLRNASALMGS
jgi:hypothetical protein